MSDTAHAFFLLSFAWSFLNLSDQGSNTITHGPKGPCREPFSANRSKLPFFFWPLKVQQLAQYLNNAHFTISCWLSKTLCNYWPINFTIFLIYIKIKIMLSNYISELGFIFWSRNQSPGTDCNFSSLIIEKFALSKCQRRTSLAISRINQSNQI